MTETRKRALILDDEKFNRRALARALKSKFDVVAAGTFDEATELLQTQGPFDVIVSDRSLGPGPTGIHFLAAAHVSHPETARVMASGTVVDKEARDAVARRDVERFVAKPWRPGELLETVCELLTERARGN